MNQIEKIDKNEDNKLSEKIKIEEEQKSQNSNPKIYFFFNLILNIIIFNIYLEINYKD